MPEKRNKKKNGMEIVRGRHQLRFYHRYGLHPVMRTTRYY